MLVLSRQRDETIMIGDDIEITVVDIRGDKVRLGINAPTKIAVHRKEVYEAIRRENEQASSMTPDGIEDITRSLGGASIRPGPAKRQGRSPSRATDLSAGRPGAPGVHGTPKPAVSADAPAPERPGDAARGEPQTGAAGRRTA